MTLVKMDQKMRIRVPRHLSEKLKLKGREVFEIKAEGDGLLLTRPKKVDTSNNLILRDMIERPMHSKIKITSELLEKWEDEMYS